MFELPQHLKKHLHETAKIQAREAKEEKRAKEIEDSDFSADLMSDKELSEIDANQVKVYGVDEAKKLSKKRTN